MSASKPTIALVRETTLLTDAFVQSIVTPLQTQISRDFAPAWNQDATVIFVPGGSMIPGGAWRVLLLDNSDQADALGYHDDTGPAGEPISKVFVADILNDKLNWVVTVSHEVLEMLADPQITRVVDVSGFEYCVEVCDAPEDDEFAYNIDGHMFSDFVLPSWFDPNGVTPFTHCRNPQITAPFMLASGGYIGRRTLPDGQWSQVLAGQSARQVKGVHSRTLRRFNAG